MAINKVNYFGQTLIDLSGDTLTSADQLLKDIVAHDKAGNIITGTLEAGGGGLEYNRLYPAATGTFTPTERIECDYNNPLILQHDAGIIPILITIESNGMTRSDDLDVLAMWRVRHYNASYYYLSRTYTLSSSRGSTTSARIVQISAEPGSGKAAQWSAQSVPVFAYNSTFYFAAGKTYTWIAYGVD